MTAGPGNLRQGLSCRLRSSPAGAGRRARGYHRLLKQAQGDACPPAGPHSACGSAQLWSEGGEFGVQRVTGGGEVAGETQSSLTAALGRVWKSRYLPDLRPLDPSQKARAQNEEGGGEPLGVHLCLAARPENWIITDPEKGTAYEISSRAQPTYLGTSQGLPSPHVRPTSWFGGSHILPKDRAKPQDIFNHLPCKLSAAASGGVEGEALGGGGGGPGGPWHISRARVA